jgi:hypothetical protein
MKLNREKFLAAAIAVSAASGGCKLKSDSTAAQATPEQQAQQTGLTQGPGVPAAAPEMPAGGVDTESQNSKLGIKSGAQRTASPTKEAQLMASPTKEAITTSPTKEAITTSPTKEAIKTSPTKEVLTKPPPAPTKETLIKAR